MATKIDFIDEVMTTDGIVEPDRLVDILRITKVELAHAVGLSRSAISKKSRLKAKKTQSRLRDTVEVINRILPWSGSVQQAFAWYRSQPIPSFGDLTAEDLVKDGRAEAVKRHLSRIAAGGYA